MPDERAHSSTNAIGYIEAFDPEKGKMEFDTLRCPHCSGHFVVRPGSGKVRSFCGHCNRLLCDLCSVKFAMNGMKCVHVEQLLHNIEHGLPDDFVPTVVAMPGKLWLPQDIKRPSPIPGR